MEILQLCHEGIGAAPRAAFIPVPEVHSSHVFGGQPHYNRHLRCLLTSLRCRHATPVLATSSRECFLQPSWQRHLRATLQMKPNSHLTEDLATFRHGASIGPEHSTPFFDSLQRQRTEQCRRLRWMGRPSPHSTLRASWLLYFHRERQQLLCFLHHLRSSLRKTI